MAPPEAIRGTPIETEHATGNQSEHDDDAADEGAAREAGAEGSPAELDFNERVQQLLTDAVRNNTEGDYGSNIRRHASWRHYSDNNARNNNSVLVETMLSLHFGSLGCVCFAGASRDGNVGGIGGGCSPARSPPRLQGNTPDSTTNLSRDGNVGGIGGGCSPARSPPRLQEDCESAREFVPCGASTRSTRVNTDTWRP
eukprot:4470969-Pyramimonas_sp.AAC.1